MDSDYKFSLNQIREGTNPSISIYRHCTFGSRIFLPWPRIFSFYFQRPFSKVIAFWKYDIILTEIFMVSSNDGF